MGYKKIENIAGRRGIVPFLFVLFFSFQLSAQDSKYDINDPRNPNCPCHKYQKLADEEYKKMLRTRNGVGELASRTVSRKDKIHKSRIEKYRKQKHKIRDKKIRIPRWIYKFKHWDIWKRVTDPGKCPIWNDR